MRQFFLIISLLGCLSFTGKAQETKPTFEFKFYGFVRYEGFYDTRNSVTSRYNDIYLFPKAENIANNGDDLNSKGKLTMFGYQTRAGVKISGPEILGAKTSANIEGDFMGTAEAVTGQLRLRHAYVKMQWEKSNLIFGQYWHPMFATQIFPAAEATAPMVPFFPLSRNPQIRFTYNLTNSLSLSAAALGHGEYKSVGANANPQVEAGIPEFTGQLAYTKGAFSLTATVAQRTIQPNTATASNATLDKTLSSVNYSLSASIKKNGAFAKAGALYGGNFSSLKMIGGYAVSDADNNYTNINTLSLWGEVGKTFNNFHIALFGGYAKNMGSKDPIMGSIYYLAPSEGKYIDYTYRIYPTICYCVKNIRFSFEPMYTVTSWGDFNIGDKKVTNGKEVNNTRLLFAVNYSF